MREILDKVRWHTMDTRHKQLHDRANDLFSRQQYQQLATTSSWGDSSNSRSSSNTKQQTPQQQQHLTSSSPRHSNNSQTQQNNHNSTNPHHQPRDLHLSCLNKRATCFLKLDQNEKALDDINKLLSMSPTRSSLGKLLMRKTQALSKLRKTQEAYETAKQWTSAEPKNGQASKEVNRLKKLLDEKTENPSTSRNTSARDKNGTEASLHPSQSSGRGQGASGGSASSASSSHHQRGKRKPASEGKHKKDASKQENSENFCSYCQVQCSTQVDFHLHSMSESHRAIISSDEGRDWKHRPPPRGAVGEEYVLCADRLKCRFGQQCPYAHSEDELAEWKERYRYRQMKYQRARDKQIHGMSFAEQLFEKWMNSPAPLNVLSESIDDVKVSINSESNVTVSSKNTAHSWIFTLHCKPSKQLQRVALFFDVHRPHFSIASILMGDSKRQSSQDIPENCQEWSSKMSSHNNNNINPYNSAKSKERIYRVKIQFTSQIFGTFRQSVVFDFGTEPVLMKRISVDSVSAMDQKELEEVRESMMCVTERWDGTNKTVVNFSPPIQMGTEEDKGLLSFYIPPHSTEELFKRSVLEKTITKNNYKNRMHDLLYIEETARFRDISKFNIRTTLQMATTFMLVPSRNSGARYAQDGQLFALMHLNDDLSDDTPGGRLILNSCSSVLLAPVQDGKTTEKVYEAPITEKSKDSIYMTLSKECVDDLKLKNNSQIRVELQFQLSRLHLCEMHYAVDKVPDMSLLFPDVRSNAKIPWTPNKQWSDKMDMQMNSKQREAIVAMTTPLVHQLPPIFLVGPYGTGKTYTLAHATRLILQQPKTRILICTHSNSAADLYIRDYFHSFVESGNTAAKPLRIYFKDRWVPTVHPVVRLYCCMSEGEDRFVMPTKEQVEKHRVVVATLSTSRFLTHLELDQDYFTHILLDEAAQAMECETVMPLALATKNTRIVLAGDYMQISPQVHSEFVYDRKLHISLLERLYDHYPDTHPCKILLCANYRSHDAIVDYTSDLFYDGKLLASGKQPPHPKWYPLTFFTARGEDVQEKNSISFYNNAEVFELCDRVQELQKTWPEEWGTCDENSIGVVAHYSDQVFRIRHELRKRKLFNVSVERVMNVQGKQFRALFISTVRTHHTCKHMVKAQPAKKSNASSKSSKDLPQSSSEDEPDYGFLSNDKLLNTAITRAQSLVAVVGDPISACSIGKCRKLWEKFISMCNDNNSLHGCTFSSIQNQLSNVEMKKTYVLNPLAKEFIPRAMRNQMMGVPFIQGSPAQGIATINHNLHRSVLSPSHTPTPPVPGNQPLPFFGGVGAIPSGNMVRPASPVPLIDPYTGRRVVYMPMMHMPVPVRMVPNAYYPFPQYPYMEPAVPYHPQFMHQGGFMIPQGVKHPHGQPGSPAHQSAQDKSQGSAFKEASASSSTMHPGTTHRIAPGSPARDPRPMSLPIGQFDSSKSQHERQEVVAKIEEMQINEEYQYLLRTRGQTYADNFLANVKRSQSPKVGPGRPKSDTAPQSKVSQQQQGQQSQSLYTDKTEAIGASGHQLPFSRNSNHWNTSSEINQSNRDPWPSRSKSHNPRDTLDSTGNQPRICDPAIIDQGPAFSKNQPGHRMPFSPLEMPPNVFVDSHMPPYHDHEAEHQRDFSVQPSDLSPRTPANFMDASPGLSPLELAIQLGDAKGSFLGKPQGKSFTFNGTSSLTSPRDDPNHLAPPNSQTSFGHQPMLGKEHTFRPVSKDDRSTSPLGAAPPVGHQRWPQSSMSNNFSSTLSPQHHQQEYNNFPQSQGLQNFSPTTPSLSSQESLPSPSSPYGQGSTSSLLGLSSSPTNFKDDSKPSMSYASALRAPPKPKVRAKDERTKTASPDPLSLIKDLGNRQTKDGFYSIF
ncbi:probable helicase with zinc finger domain isoform X3 [Lytechinus variegatus]|uniref:probable helicase with zinc finger domain isoform X3 n=1 Tax=Lytechinus variegatus TaxID=7654 RepID=UPI001BB2830F|nr:probable helicase with zinc finger domain isoform X3 [Lytechinus variegatus]